HAGNSCSAGDAQRNWQPARSKGQKARGYEQRTWRLRPTNLRAQRVAPCLLSFTAGLRITFDSRNLSPEFFLSMSSQSAIHSPKLELPTMRIAPSKGWVPLKLKDLWEYRELLYFLI